MLLGARTAVVIPAFDEHRLIARTVSSVPGWVDEVLVVDDASRDATPLIVVELADPRVTLVRHAVNRGVGAALATGYRVAFERGADVVAVMAGDGQMHPDDLEAVVRPVALREADYAKGDRLSHPEVRARMPRARWIGNHVLTALTRVATGLHVRDSQCGYTALHRAAYERVQLDHLWPRYGYPNDLLSMLSMARLRVRDVPVRPLYGEEVSGIRAHHLATHYPLVLGRGLSRRIRRRLGI
ncbi:MAG: glycosyltransferase family 2 protein [Sandaracinaceae bacterium]